MALLPSFVMGSKVRMKGKTDALFLNRKVPSPNAPNKKSPAKWQPFSSFKLQVREGSPTESNVDPQADAHGVVVDASSNSPSSPVDR